MAEEKQAKINVNDTEYNLAWIMDANLLVKEIFPFDLSIYLNVIRILKRSQKQDFTMPQS